MFNSLSTTLAVFGFCTMINGHMILQIPVPYDTNQLVKDPITLAQFPCQNHNYQINKTTAIAAGSTQPISWIGRAVHGGGSCQLAVTYDLKPTPQSIFKVVQSWIGGCPVEEGQSMKWNMPKGMPNGQASLSWTWNSQEAGAAELYMNCAPIEITGGSNDKNYYNSLPDLSRVNIPAAQQGDKPPCRQIDNTNVDYPNPGPNAITLAKANIAAPTGPGCEKKTAGGAQPSGGSGSPGSSSAAAPTSAPAASSSPAGFAPTNSASGAGAGSDTTTTFATSFVTMTSGAAAPTSGSNSTGGSSGSSGSSGSGSSGSGSSGSDPSSGSSGSSSGSSGSDPSSSSGSGNGTSSGGSSSGSACSTNGAIVCQGTTQFGLCNNGNVVFQPVAAGTTCQNGQIMRRKR
ncbi:MAG: hypothetical protein M1820_000545 [Bogoriella megaspora]|nr:MAG: hypothetical protein M1820_000545 [Bogoriella megaspora]